jgi:hypothetical protein
VCAVSWNKIPGLECAEKFPKQFDIDPSYVSNHRSVLHYCQSGLSSSQLYSVARAHMPHAARL